MSSDVADDNVLVLMGLHPSDLHCDLVMRDFNQDILIARVMPPARQPKVAAMMPVLMRSDSVDESVKRRLHRRLDSQQLTNFNLSGIRFQGRIIQVDYYRQQSLCEDALDMEVLSMVIGVVAVSGTAGQQREEFEIKHITGSERYAHEQLPSS